MNLEWEKTDGESKLSKSPFITDSSYLRVFNSTIIYKDIENINIKSIFKFNVTEVLNPYNFLKSKQYYELRQSKIQGGLIKK